MSADAIRANDYDLSINKYKEVEREHVEYEASADILARLDAAEKEYCEGLQMLKTMLLEEKV